MIRIEFDISCSHWCCQHLLFDSLVIRLHLVPALVVAVHWVDTVLRWTGLLTRLSLCTVVSASKGCLCPVDAVDEGLQTLQAVYPLSRALFSVISMLLDRRYWQLHLWYLLPVLVMQTLKSCPTTQAQETTRRKNTRKFLGRAFATRMVFMLVKIYNSWKSRTSVFPMGWITFQTKRFHCLTASFWSCNLKLRRGQCPVCIFLHNSEFFNWK